MIGLGLVAIEATIWGVGTWIGSVDRLRLWVVSGAGFWTGLLGDWQANFPGQPVTMFATYWLIHSGPTHLLGNLLMIFWFARRIGPDLRPVEMLEIWLASILGGAIMFGLLSQSCSPMIGASGGVFGLLGAFVVIAHAEVRHASSRRAAILQTVALCVGIMALSLVDFTLRNAVLAWQTHLGGFLAGAIVTWTIVPENRIAP